MLRNLRFAAAVSRPMMLLRATRPVSFRMRLRARLIRLAMLLAVAAMSTGALAACSSAGSVTIPGTGPLMTVSMRGGMCMDGPCDRSVIVERDGRVHESAKPPNDLGVVATEAMQALTAAVQAADYTAIKAVPFTGECPVAFDGQELIFEFNVGAVTQKIASCEVEIDWSNPLFVAIAVALGEWIPIPLM